MIALMGFATTDLGVEMFVTGWCERGTVRGAQAVSVGLQMILLGLVALL